jgi:hypothetical protein
MVQSFLELHFIYLGWIYIRRCCNLNFSEVTVLFGLPTIRVFWCLVFPPRNALYFLQLRRLNLLQIIENLWCTVHIVSKELSFQCTVFYSVYSCLSIIFRKSLALFPREYDVATTSVYAIDGQWWFLPWPGARCMFMPLVLGNIGLILSIKRN